MTARGRNIVFYCLAFPAVVILFCLLLLTGPVKIPFGEIFKILFGHNPEVSYWSVIVLDTRLPMAIAALCCGASLSVAGLVMQTTFMNPLAGPSILGVTSGASLGVALCMLGGLSFSSPAFTGFANIFGALIGAFAVVLIILFFSSLLKNGVMLLIVGIMISYLASSFISLLNFFSPAEEIRSYLFWGLGSFSGLQLHESVWLLIFSLVVIIFSMTLIKPLNALLLGERYAVSMGYSMTRLRALIFLITGFLIAVPTAYCGPIGFIGLIVPHFARLILRSSNHVLLMPACAVLGGITAMFCALLSVLPADAYGVLPVNVITPIIGIPVIVYILVNRNRLLYFR